MASGIDPERLRAGAAHGRLPCDPPVASVSYGTTADATVSARLRALFEADQAARSTEPIDWTALTVADQQHRVEVLDYLARGQVVTGDDLYYAAMVFQHGTCVDHFKLANELAAKAMEQGQPSARWLYAASLDRLLMNQGQPQRYGTQFFQYGGHWELYPVDPTTTDADREQYDVEPLATLLERAAEMNRR